MFGLSRRRLVQAAAFAPFASPGALFAQEYPSRPVSLVVGFPAGGSSDAVARLLAQKLAVTLKQPVVVENKPGAGGTIGAAAVASAKPDGHTLLFVTSGHSGVGALYPKLSFDPLRSFEPVVGISAFPVLVVVNASSPYRTLGDIVAAARKSPGKLDYTAGGGGATVTAMAAEFLKREAGIEMQQINFTGSGPALTALISGQIDIGFDLAISSLAHIRSGKLRPVAVTSSTRSQYLPDVPTAAEQGVPGFDMLGWFGIVAPAGTPPSVVARLNKEFNDALALPEVKEQFAALAIDAYGGPPAKFQRLLESDTRRVGDAIRRMGLKAS